MDYTQKLKVYRQLNGKTQLDIAEKLGIGLVSYNQKENGKKEFTLSEAKKIADLFNVSVDYIFFNPNVNFMNTKNNKEV